MILFGMLDGVETIRLLLFLFNPLSDHLVTLFQTINKRAPIHLEEIRFVLCTVEDFIKVIILGVL